MVLPVLLMVFSLFTPDFAPATTRSSTSTSTTSTTSTTTTARTAAATVPSVCLKPARRGFVPTRANVAGVGRRIPVLAMGRHNRIPLPPPLTALGKRSFAWDKYGPKPGAKRGNVRFNAHTYPDGSALGNRLLAKLWVGQRIILRGNGKAICYKVRRRVTVSPTQSLAAYYRTTGLPKLAIVVCSGRRLGPGRWTSRTIWYARPSTS